MPQNWLQGSSENFSEPEAGCGTTTARWAGLLLSLDWGAVAGAANHWWAPYISFTLTAQS